MNKNDIDNLIQFDRDHIWHPYTSMSEPLAAYPVVAANGVEIELADGRKLIDGMSSWWCAIHGYNHPAINQAVKDQLDKMSHVMFGGITHQPAVNLAKKLLDITPKSLQHVFLADSGSVSVEVAIKMALQYFQTQGPTTKTSLLTVRGGYHGDTIGCMSVCDPVTGMHHLFTDILPKQIFAERPSCRFDQPYDPDSIDNLAGLLKDNASGIAAVIIEPVVQGAGGMWFYHPQYLSELRELCNRHNVLLIFDEIATGFGRTGKMFACQWSDIAPDIMTVGKAVTGGYMTLAAALATEKVAVGISDNGGVFMHGPTFMANPLACAAASASLDLLAAGNWKQQVSDIQTNLKSLLENCRSSNKVADVRVLGAIGVVEMKEPVDVAAIQKFFVDNGVWIRPFGKLIYLMPPYITKFEQLQQLCSTITNWIDKMA